MRPKYILYRYMEPYITVLKESWDLVTRVIITVIILTTPIKVRITLLDSSKDRPSRESLDRRRH